MNCGMCDAHFSEEWLEAEGFAPKEGVECPNCKWTTTIQPDEGENASSEVESNMIELEEGVTLLCKEE